MSRLFAAEHGANQREGVDRKRRRAKERMRREKACDAGGVGDTVANYTFDERLRGREGRMEGATLRNQATNVTKKAKFEGKRARRQAIFGAIDGTLGAGVQGMAGGPGGASGGFTRLFG